MSVLNVMKMDLELFGKHKRITVLLNVTILMLNFLTTIVLLNVIMDFTLIRQLMLVNYVQMDAKYALMIHHVFTALNSELKAITQTVDLNWNALKDHKMI